MQANDFCINIALFYMKFNPPNVEYSSYSVHRVDRIRTISFVLSTFC